MSYETLIPACQKLNAQMETLAAIGALLKARPEGLTLDPRIAPLLGAIAEGVEPSLLQGLDEGQRIGRASSIACEGNDAPDSSA